MSHFSNPGRRVAIVLGAVLCGQTMADTLPRPTTGLRRLTTEEMKDLLRPRIIVCRKPVKEGGRTDLCIILDTDGRYLEIRGPTEGTYIIADAELCITGLARRLPTVCYGFYVDQGGEYYRTKTAPGPESDARPISIGPAPLGIGPRSPATRDRQ